MLIVITQVYQKTKTGVVVESHRACADSERIGKNLFLIGDNVCDFQTMIVFREYIAIDRKNCMHYRNRYF